MVPNLRFPGFEDAWEVKKLGEVATNFMYGMNTAATVYDGENQYIRITDIDERTRLFTPNPLSSPDGELEDKYLLEKGDILFARTGASVGKSYLYSEKDGKIFFAGFLIRLNVKTENPYFIFSQTLTEKYQKWVLTMSMRSGQPGINAEEYKLLSIVIPSIQEQEKISSFLLLIDERIQTQNKIIEQLETLIKNVSEKIFSQNIKFKKFEKKWEVKTLGEILIEINERTINSNQYRVLSSTAKGLFYQSDYFNKEVASKDNAGYKILKINQLVFSPQNLWLGNINVNTTYEIGIVSPSYKVFSFNEKAIVSYCKYFLKSSKMMFEYEQCSEQGASIVRRNLNMDLFLNIPILLPKLEEQIQISSFLTKIDQKIQTEKAILEQLEIQKKYLLQQMFV
jgi:type I restriction enzyme S subunit